MIWVRLGIIRFLQVPIIYLHNLKEGRIHQAIQHTIENWSFRSTWKLPAEIKIVKLQSWNTWRRLFLFVFYFLLVSQCNDFLMTLFCAIDTGNSSADFSFTSKNTSNGWIRSWKLLLIHWGNQLTHQKPKWDIWYKISNPFSVLFVNLSNIKIFSLAFFELIQRI